MNNIGIIMSDKSLTLKEILQDIDARIAHIEDMTADNRSVIVKLVKQSNQVVEFLKQLEVENVESDIKDLEFDITIDDTNKNKFKNLTELVGEFMERQKDLIELEKELKKYKDEITPDQVGEA
tara:strand:+ start:118 stop:486 length:369 start_codon:yes stop_codon:yes gene_type:complete